MILKGTSILKKIVFGCLIGIFAILSVACILFSCNLVLLVDETRTMYYLVDSVWINVLLLCILFLLLRKTKEIDSEKINKIAIVIMLVFVGLVGFIWVNIVNFYPQHDPQVIFETSIATMNNDYSGLLGSNNYFFCYPWQVRMVGLYQVLFNIMSVFGDISYKTPQMLNIVFLLLTFYFLQKISYQLFENRRVQLVCIVLLAICVQPILFCTYSYGNIIGLGLNCLAISALLSFLEDRRYLSLAISSIALSVSIIAKYNSSISLIAFIMILGFELIKSRKVSYLIGIIVLLVVNYSADFLTMNFYENKTGVDFGKGVPITSYITMGFSEGKAAPGWYNFYNTDLYYECNQDYSCQINQSLEDLKGRTDVFLGDPLYFGEFMSKKLFSEWGEPTFQTLDISKRQDYSFSVLLDSIYNGILNKVIVRYCDVYSIVVYIGFLISLVLNKNRSDNAFFLIPLIVFGSLIYYLISEGKSQYLLPTFVLLIPYASNGIIELKSRIMK